MPVQIPGVSVEERTLPNVVTTGTRVASAAFIGLSDRGSTTPVRMESWGAFVARFGSFGSSELHYAVFNYFGNGGRVAYVTRVVGTGATASTLAIAGSYGAGASTASTIFTIAAANPGTWGTTVTAAVTALASRAGTFDLTVLSGTTQVEKFTSLSMSPTDPRYVESVINSATSGSTYVTVTTNPTVEASLLLATTNDAKFSAVTGSALTGGAAGAAPAAGDWTTAVTAQDAIVGPFLLNLAGTSDSTVVNNALTYAGNRKDVFVIIDADAASSQAKNVATIPNYTLTSYGAVYYPRVLMSDPLATISGGTRWSQPSGSIAGVYVATDATRGVFKTPAGINAAIAGGLALEHQPTNTELESLNNRNVNALKLQPNLGNIVVFGGRTLKPSTIDMYISVRRSLIYLEQVIPDAIQFAVFEPNDKRLWDMVQNQAQRILTEFWTAGGLKGVTAQQAFYATCDSSNNTDATVDAGYVYLDVGVALQKPAEFVVLRIGVWSGSAQITETL